MTCSLKILLMAAAVLLLSGCSERLGCDAAIVNLSKETLQDLTFVVDGKTIRAGWLSGGAQKGFISVIYHEPKQAKITWRTEGGHLMRLDCRSHPLAAAPILISHSG